MSVVHKAIVPTLLLFFIGLVLWFGSVNSAKIAELQKQGRAYSDTAVTTVEPKDGKPGESAYEIAVRNGFGGTEEEWLASLRSIMSGEPGLSAYQMAQLLGYAGTQDEWIASLKGDKGDPGPQGSPGVDGQSITGPAGTDGANGSKGVNGEPPTSWRWTYAGIEYECTRADPFDPAKPTYGCKPVEAEPAL